MSLAERALLRWRTPEDLVVLSRMSNETYRLNFFECDKIFKVPDEEKKKAYEMLHGSGLFDLLKEEVDPQDEVDYFNIGEPDHIYLIGGRFNTGRDYRGEEEVLGIRLQYNERKNSIELITHQDRSAWLWASVTLFSTGQPFVTPFRHLTFDHLRVLLELFGKYAKGKPVAKHDPWRNVMVGPHRRKADRNQVVFPW